jgi:hypothetical protein
VSNPFVRFGIDPSATLAQITERMRELAEDASDEERAALRAAWEAIARSPARRFELALEAGPTPSPVPQGTARAEPPTPWIEPALRDVLATPPLRPMLPSESAEEAALRSIDLAFLVTPDEADVTGPVRPRRLA